MICAKYAEAGFLKMLMSAEISAKFAAIEADLSFAISGEGEAKPHSR